eukprot:TRINITY_DN23683_c0_g1_i1.p1 TRINITY_DN23683_c0_g1~~TRINITY_DN23683_c0_g1_i1.p1  ORF type:complete len:530 (+),score=144.06 TRINITY_DN23683_c0_g1_i1:76-1590(+)
MGGDADAAVGAEGLPGSLLRLPPPQPKKRPRVAARARVLDLAFHHFLQQRNGEDPSPGDFLRARRRGEKRPNRLAELHVLEDTCSTVLRRRLRESPPPGMRCVFYTQNEQHRTHPGALNPSRVVRFRRERPPCPSLSFAPLAARRGGSSPPAAAPPSPHRRPYSAPATLLCGGLPAGGLPAAAQPPAAALRAGRRKSKGGRRAMPAIPRAKRAVAKLVQAQLGIFEHRCGLIGVESDDDADDVSEVRALQDVQEKLLKEHEALYQQGAFATSAATSTSPAREPVDLSEDPCAEAAGECAKVMHLVREVKRATVLQRAVNHVTLHDAKMAFGVPAGLGELFIIRKTAFMQTLSVRFEGVMCERELEKLWRVLEHPLSDDNDRYMEGEQWLLSCHFVWRARGGDREAILKTFYYMLQNRAIKEGDAERANAALSEVQVALAAYKSKRHHSPAVVELIESALVRGMPWDMSGKVTLDVLVAAVENHNGLRDILIGAPDAQYTYFPRQ